MTTIAERVALRFAASDAAFWVRRQQTAEREIQNIKKRLKKYHGGVFEEYLGLGADEANSLRKALEEHRVLWQAARELRNPTKAEINQALRKLGPAVQRAK